MRSNRLQCIEQSARAGVALLAVCLLSALVAARASAAVVVLANRTGAAITFRFQPAAGAEQQFHLAAGEVRPVFVDGPCGVAFTAAGQAKQYRLDVNSAYFFGRDDRGRMDLQKIGLDDSSPSESAKTSANAGQPLHATPPVISVKILVDEEQPARQFAWEPLLRKRMEAASAILQKHSGVQFKIVGYGTWNSDDSTSEFEDSLREFEKEVDPGPARLAIGFTSQFPLAQGRIHMAGTRGPLSSHILVREGTAQVNDAERLEFLVHELGHFLGASHSPERSSVMRPVLGDNQAGRPGFQIAFDPVNSLIMSSVAEEMSLRNVQRFTDLSAPLRRRLQAIYRSLEQTLPNDPASGHFIRLAGVAELTPQMLGSAKGMLNAFVYTATLNHALLPSADSAAGQPPRRQGDALTEYLVRQSAQAANRLPKETGRPAFLLTLAVGIDDGKTVQQFEAARSMAQAIESPSDRALRLRMLDTPTVRERRDVARRFFAAAYVASVMGVEPAKEALLLHELNATQGACDFALIAADRCGATWGGEVMAGRLSLELLGVAYSPALMMPTLDGLPAIGSPAEFAAQFGNSRDQRFLLQLHVIDERIAALPAYRAPGR